MNWLLISEICYVTILAAVCVRIVYDTSNTTKSLAYLLLAIFVPVAGMLFYFAFGINYRKRQLYSKKILDDESLWESVKKEISEYSFQNLRESEASAHPNFQLAKFLTNEMSPLSAGNSVQFLVNGEEKFPAVLKALEEAKDHIHIEYYIVENDKIGQIIEEILVKKVKEGVTVRFIYDDFGSRGIRKNIARNLKSQGVNVFPFYKIVLMRVANRINYRNHRKIIVIDGKKAFVGGINISNRYINDETYPAKNKIYWRDTHLMLEGPGVHFLQYLFICDWNFCSRQPLQDVFHFFPDFADSLPGNKLVQIAASGPDSNRPTIVYSLLYAIQAGKKEILVTTPYFIPEQSVMDALVMAALGGITVKLLVPEKSDSSLVALAASSYYGDLLSAGVQIYFYKKGFVHAKTLVVDRRLAMIGTANMDFRSFDLNFEVNAIVYDEELAGSLAKIFDKDLESASLVDFSTWNKRSFFRQLLEKIARLVSPLL